MYSSFYSLKNILTLKYKYAVYYLLFLKIKNECYKHMWMISMNIVKVNERTSLLVENLLKVGFEVYKRSEFDKQGNSYPILFMKRRN